MRIVRVSNNSNNMVIRSRQNTAFSSAPVGVHNVMQASEKFLSQLKKDADNLSLKKILQEINDQNISPIFTWKIFMDFRLNEGFDYEGIERLLDLKKEVSARANQLYTYYTNSVDNDLNISSLLFLYPKATYDMLELIGKSAFLYALKDKYENVKSYIEILGKDFTNDEVRQSLSILVNPTESKLYAKLEEEIKTLKKTLPNITEEREKQLLFERINSRSSMRNEILRNSIKDPKQVLEYSLIIALLSNYDSKQAFELLRSIKKRDEKNINSILNNAIFKLLNKEEFFQNFGNINEIQFSNKKYLPRLFYAKQDFKIELQKILEIIEQNPDKTIKEIIENLPQNKKTREEFEVLGLDFDKWTEYREDFCYIPQGSELENFKIKKVDMNNIGYSLFLGDYSACCTRVNGTHAKSAVTYIMNNMIQAFEILDNGVPIGNAMYYLAFVDDKLSLIVDNIECQPNYQYNSEITSAIAEFLQKLVVELGQPDMQILVSAVRNDVPLGNYPYIRKDCEMIGTTDDDKIYIDRFNKLVSVKNNEAYDQDRVLNKQADFYVIKSDKEYNDKKMDFKSDISYDEGDFLIYNSNVANDVERLALYNYEFY